MKKYVVGFLFGVFITALLSLVLIVGVGTTEQPETAPGYGVVRLAVLPAEPNANDDIAYSVHEIPSIQKYEALEVITPATEIPNFETSLANLEIDFAPEIAGTVALGGVPAVVPVGGFGVAGGGVLTIGEVDELPHPIYAPTPIYPAAMKRIGKEKKVLIRIVLDETGAVTAAEPINETEESAMFHQSAIATILKWRFFPCKKNGKAVKCVADQPIAFTLNN
ncbi:MAG: energy transducer TonB [Desulfuromonadales bacterium]|nr:energy transducer TonB [Desulfuromonadales bacterium]